jgi:hypothetical protein
MDPRFRGDDDTGDAATGRWVSIYCGEISRGFEPRTYKCSRRETPPSKTLKARCGSPAWAFRDRALRQE